MRILGTLALLGAALLAVAAVAPPEAAHACSCEWPGSVSALVDREDLVVTAHLVSSDWMAHPSDPGVTPLGVRVTIEVERYLKGSGPEVIDVYDSPTSCGVMLGSAPGERWLVLASLDDTGAYHTGRCSGTTRIDPPDPAYHTDETALATYLREFETVFGIPGAVAGPQAAPPGGGRGHPTAASGLWIIPLLMAAGAGAAVTGLGLLTTCRRRARP